MMPYAIFVALLGALVSFEVMPDLVPWFLGAMGAGLMIALVLMITVGGMSLLPPAALPCRRDGLDDGLAPIEDEKP